MANLQRALRTRNLNLFLNCMEETGEGFNLLSTVALTLVSKRMERSYEKMGEANTQLQALLDAEADENDTEGFMDPHDQAYRIESLKIANRIAALRAEQAIPPPRQGELNQLKRPFENIGVFNGNHADWPSFRDLFRALVIDQEYDDFERFLLLQRACKGTAARTIAGYEACAASFNQAWSALKAIYEDKHAVTQALIDRMFDLPPAKVESPDELRRVIDTITSTRRQLIGMGYQCAQWDPITMNLLARKMPRLTMGDWEQTRKADQPPTLDDLSAFLEARARKRIFTAEPQVRGENRSNQENRPSNGRHYQRAPEPTKPLRPRNSDYMTKRPQNETSRWPEQCPKCKGPHRLYKCPDVINITNPQERRRALIGVDVCYNCFQSGHMAPQCPQTGCMKCNAKHNRLICPYQGGQGALAHQVHFGGAKRSRAE